MKRQTILLAALLLFSSVTFSQQNDPRLAKASREDKNGWIYVHLEGSPREIGYQHGYLLAGEIEDLIHSFQLSLPHLSAKDWAFYRDAARTMFWNKIDKEYQEEITGITEGTQGKRQILRYLRHRRPERKHRALPILRPLAGRSENSRCRR